MQLIVGFQVEQVYLQLAMQPEVERVLEDVSGFRQATDRFAGLLEELPDHVSAERVAAFQMVADERRAVLAAFDERQAVLHGLMKEVQATLDRVDGTFSGLRRTTADVERLLAGTEKSALVFQDLVQSVDRLAARFEAEPSKAPSEPLDIDDVTRTLASLQETVVELNELVTSVDRTGSPLVDRVADRLNQTAEERINHVFWRMVWLFLILGAVGMALILVHHRLRRRPSG
jgi:ABC-type transporter Mla subunit MlaD